MGRKLDPKCKQCRRAGEKLFLKGEKCFTPKCPIVRRNYPPGVHGPVSGFKKQAFGYSKQLLEKQKVKRVYGLLEKQFANYVELARRKPGDAGIMLREMLEMRLDNVVFKAGFGRSRAEARQIVNHGLINVNNKNVNIPSFQAKLGDIITINPTSENKKIFSGLKEKLEKITAPSWMSIIPEKAAVNIVSKPKQEDFDFAFDTKPIIEFYSR